MGALQTSADTQPYWDRAAQGRFSWLRCSSCGKMQNVPRNFCTNCRGDGIEWVDIAPGGVIASISHVFRAPNKTFSNRVPYTIVLVELDAGPQLMFNLVGRGSQEAAIGDRVEIFIDRQGDDGVAIPQARRA